MAEAEVFGELFGLFGVYRGFFQFLQTGLGYVEYDYFNPVESDPSKIYQEKRRRMNGSPNLNQGTSVTKEFQLPELFVFAYDWRLDHKRASDLLDEYVKN